MKKTLEDSLCMRTPEVSLTDLGGLFTSYDPSTEGRPQPQSLHRVPGLTHYLQLPLPSHLPLSLGNSINGLSPRRRGEVLELSTIPSLLATLL